MKIIYIIGNICAGKSTCIEALKQYKAHVPFYSIDDARIENEVSNWQEDHAAWQAIIDNIIETKPAACFIECSGTGIMYEKSLNEFRKTPEIKKIVHVAVLTSIQTCLNRFYQRPKKGLFFEDKYKITQSISRINTKLLSIKADYTIDGNNPKHKMISQFLRTFGIKADSTQ